MTTTHRRRLTDQIPLGVECALPQMPSAAAARPERKRLGFWSKLVLVATALVVTAGLWMHGQGFYAQTKAWPAQALLGRAWERTLAGEREVKPWPWADTWPVARLTLPEKNLSLYILAGANVGAFGPGHIFGTALPGEDGNSVIGGRGDTHLAFLRNVKPGSELIVQRRDGTRRSYRVQAGEVLGEHETWVMKQDGWTRMTLITGYPFDALRAGGPLRYVVFADAIKRRG
jgi:sortase A